MDDNFNIRVSIFFTFLKLIIKFFRERIIAVHKPGSYKKIFSTQMKIFFIAIIFCCILLSLGGAAFSAYGSTRQTSTQHCAIISSTSKFYSTFHFTFVPFAYVASFISLCIIARLHRVRFINR